MNENEHDDNKEDGKEDQLQATARRDRHLLGPLRKSKHTTHASLMRYIMEWPGVRAASCPCPSFPRRHNKTTFDRTSSELLQVMKATNTHTRARKTTRLLGRYY